MYTTSLQWPRRRRLAVFGLWRQAGARSQKEYQGYVTRNMRRSVGLATVQEQARHIIARVPLINVPRQVLDDVLADRRRQRTYSAITHSPCATGLLQLTTLNFTHTNKHNVRRHKLVLSARACVATI